MLDIVYLSSDNRAAGGRGAFVCRYADLLRQSAFAKAAAVMASESAPVFVLPDIARPQDFPCIASFLEITFFLIRDFRGISQPHQKLPGGENMRECHKYGGTGEPASGRRELTGRPVNAIQRLC